ncbi:MAG: hypothetical protein QXQ90_06650 [Desulfurococcaceae archaeon]
MSLDVLRGKCTEEELRWLRDLELDTLEGIDEMLEGLRLAIEESSTCTNEGECVELDLLFPEDAVKRLIVALRYMGFSRRCAEAIAYAYYAELLPSRG